ncbi:acyl-CoA dehydrogenase family protein [Hydrogenophaga sp.]|uniref:acyl-CoA dehydrogenase family protein n=1 Tax=Hydrogenophaga sp. TaxID=1904254 RepID=UPI002720DB00|nr:acyl-CoA dehydrogenase family protein [Hydrogenophaga sp.]MDO9435983.1 acyl-CoA dehydrogenase family protein [Hydrogenophaga sp.]
MSWKESADHARFREELRSFFAAYVTPALRKRVRAGLRPHHGDWRDWQRIMFRQGWAAPTWPQEHGGTGWTPEQLHIYEEEKARADAPALYHQGLDLIGPIIFTYGTPAQKAQYLPRILDGRDWWCQGYSEPGAGSDLASLRTSALRDGDSYVVNGQKIWTSYAHEADKIFCLVRTSREERKQQGISLLLMDIRTPGIRVRPIPLIDEDHQLNEVFFDDVRVPLTALVGEEGQGWNYGKVLLKRERAIFSAYGVRLGRQLEVLREEVDKRREQVGPLFHARLAQLEIECMALTAAGLRELHAPASDADAGWRGSMLKLRSSTLQQDIAELGVQLLGDDMAHYARVADDNSASFTDTAMPVFSYLGLRAATIYGGSSEVQHEIIARQALGL